MGFETLFQEFLKAITKYVYDKTGINLNEELQVVAQIEELLRTRTENGHQQPSEREKKEVEQMVGYLSSEATSVCVLQTAENALFSSEANKMIEIWKTEGELKPVIQRLEFYIDRTNQMKEEAMHLFKEIKEMISEKGEDLPYNLSEKDIMAMDMKKTELESALKKWKMLTDLADEALPEFSNDIQVYQERVKNTTLWTVGMCVAVGVLTGGAAAIATGVGGIVAAVGIEASAAGTLIGGSAAGGFSLSFIGGKRYHSKKLKELTTKYLEFKRDIKALKIEYEEAKISYDIDLAKKK